ncbi:MAG: anti-sigma factor family protein [Bacteroidales bacterium]
MNRKINIHNYEEFFLDYLDGNLSENEIIKLEKFLLEHPDLRKELEGMENMILPDDKTSFPVPENLKHIDLSLPVGEDNFDFYCIAYMEGDLNDNQKVEFEHYLEKNPGKKTELEIFSRAHLNPEKGINYTDKAKLKKSVFILYKRELRTAAAIAAGIALLLTFWFTFMDQNPELNSFAVLDDKEKQVIEKTDSTSAAVKPSAEKEVKPESTNEKLKSIPEKSKEAIKKAATKISYKVGIPIASADQTDSLLIPQAEEIDSELILQKASIDPRLLSSVSPIPGIKKETLSPIYSNIGPSQKKAGNPEEYLTLQEFAVQKLSDLIFREEKKDLNAINLASAGIDKLNTVAGTNMKLEASAKEGTGEKVISFNSRIISFSTPINRED